jgi:hypothetical protein
MAREYLPFKEDVNPNCVAQFTIDDCDCAIATVKSKEKRVVAYV